MSITSNTGEMDKDFISGRGLSFNESGLSVDESGLSFDESGLSLTSQAYPLQYQQHQAYSLQYQQHQAPYLIQCLLLEFQPGSIKWVSNIVFLFKTLVKLLTYPTPALEPLSASCDAFAQLTFNGLKRQYLIAGLRGMSGKDGNNYFP